MDNAVNADTGVHLENKGDLGSRLRSEVYTFLLPQLVDHNEETIQKILKELTIPSAERKQKCFAAIDRSLGYIDWVSTTDFKKTSLDELEKQTKFLHLKKSSAEDKAQEMGGHEQAIQSRINENAEIPKNTLIRPYVESAQGMMLVQKQIFQREIELGNEFSALSGQFIRSNFSRKKNLDQKIALTLGKTLKIIQKGKLDPNLLKNLNYNALTQSLAAFQGELDVRQTRLEVIQKVITILNAAMKKYKETKMAQESDPSSPPKASSKRRMTFTEDSK